MLTVQMVDIWVFTEIFQLFCIFEIFSNEMLEGFKQLFLVLREMG